jgi:hypothetical protein
MVQWSPDTTTNGFYKYLDSVSRGFSLTHLSGAGCPIYGDDSLTLQCGGTVRVSLGVQKNVPRPITIEWSATVPGGLELRPASGIIRVSGNQRPTVDIQVVSSAQATPGKHTIPIRFRVLSPGKLGQTTLPIAVLEVRVGFAEMGSGTN